MPCNMAHSRHSFPRTPRRQAFGGSWLLTWVLRGIADFRHGDHECGGLSRNPAVALEFRDATNWSLSRLPSPEQAIEQAQQSSTPLIEFVGADVTRLCPDRREVGHPQDLRPGWHGPAECQALALHDPVAMLRPPTIDHFAADTERWHLRLDRIDVPCVFGLSPERNGSAIGLALEIEVAMRSRPDFASTGYDELHRLRILHRIGSVGRSERARGRLSRPPSVRDCLFARVT